MSKCRYILKIESDLNVSFWGDINDYEQAVAEAKRAENYYSKVASLIDELKNLKWEVKLEPPIGKLFYMDFVYDDGQVHLKTNRKRITLHFNWMEEVNHGTYFNR